MNGIGLQLTTALRGDFDEEVAAGLAHVERALTAGVFEYVDEIQDTWRADIERSGLANGDKLAKTIRADHYRNRGLDAAGRVFSKFPIIQLAFEADQTVRSQNGAYLLVPNPDVWPGGRVRLPAGRGGRSTTLKVAERAFGKLRFVYRQGKTSLLVATRAGEQVIVFFLLPQVRLPRMLRGKDIRNRARREAPERIQQLYVKHFEADTGPKTSGGDR